MDVAEAGKHGKKTTSQKLEDQKKVEQNFLFFFSLYSFAFKSNRRSCVTFYLLFFLHVFWQRVR